MIVGRHEALDIFRKWAADLAPVRWQGSFAGFAFGAWGLVTAVDTSELRINSLDLRSSLTVRLRDDISFNYLDSREVEGEQKKFEECIILNMGTEAPDGNPETIALAALRQ